MLVSTIKQVAIPPGAPDDESEFLGLGKVARERRRAKNEERLANAELIRAQAAAMRAMSAPQQPILGAPVPGSFVAPFAPPAPVAPQNTAPPVPGNNGPAIGASKKPLLIGGGVLLLLLLLVVVLLARRHTT